jgi:hypothetical protein
LVTGTLGYGYGVSFPDTAQHRTPNLWFTGFASTLNLCHRHLKRASNAPSVAPPMRSPPLRVQRALQRPSNAPFYTPPTRPLTPLQRALQHPFNAPFKCALKHITNAPQTRPSTLPTRPQRVLKRPPPNATSNAPSSTPQRIPNIPSSTPPNAPQTRPQTPPNAPLQDIR